MGEDEVSTVGAELYFLIHKFLSGGPLKKTLETFHNELEACKILPRRTDWEGDGHERTIDDLEHQFQHVRPDYLLQLCLRAGLAGPSTSSDRSKEVTTLLSLTKTNTSNVEYNFKQLLDHVRRMRFVRTVNTSLSCNIVNAIRGQEISGPLARKFLITPKLYSTFQFQRRTLGHLSAVYCLLFDHSGRYILTGADDLLIKLWSSRTGRLINTFRGASSEITDIAINLDNSLLAAGSIDRILRIWDLQSGVPLAVLAAHTGMITSVNFCPSPSWNFQYLITTSGDGSVAFWPYTHDGNKVNFRSKPTMYQEKMRPGQAQMVCSSFSPGGVFLATGSADHHVRVYYMKGDEGPHRILEVEVHTDRVDSIQWAHSGLRFLSGSKDGTAIIWSFECQQWKNLCLNMTTGMSSNSRPLPMTKKQIEDPKKLKVTMVAWDSSDNWAMTAVSDHTLKIWDARTGQMVKTLTGHTDKVYVLEPHPHDHHLLLSAGHDGQIFIWDIIRGETISKFVNTIENQGYGAIFDVKWSPDGNTIGASDSHGHLLIFGFGNGHTLFEQLPKELFFHTDFRPLVRDSNNYVLDEQTQVPPHLMPPPFLVDIDGNPYPPMLQRLVPGRELCNTEQLVPSVVLGSEGTQEVIQVVGDDNPRLDQNPEPSIASTTSNNVRPLGRRVRDMEGIRQSTGDWQRDPNMKWKRSTLVQPLKRNQIRKVKSEVEEMERIEMQEYHRQLCLRPHMINTGTSSEQTKSNDKKKGMVRGRYLKQPRKTTTVVLMSDLSSIESEDSEVSGYSDWVAEEDVQVAQPSKRARRSRINYDSGSRSGSGSGSNSGSGSEDGGDSREPSEEKTPPPLPPPKETTPRVNNRVKKSKLLEFYRTSEWLTEVRPRKAPYFPQMGDEVVYFLQGHHAYLDAVRLKNIYEVNSKNLPWTKITLRGYEFVKVVGIEYEIKPPRVCSLKLVLLDEESRLTGKIFYVKYHDMPDVLDFFVLKQHFEVAMSRNWQVGDKFRCMIDDGWWIGEVVARTNASEEFANSPFLCYEIKWDNGEIERMSPWDMEPLDDSRLPENVGEALPVLEEELQTILYQPNSDDWPNNDRDMATTYILSGLAKVMELAIAEPFLVPVDLNVYPTYVMIIEYPIDLSTIKARFENKFYRRVTAAQFDIRHLGINAEKFNERHSIIVKHAKILTELCLRIVKQCTMHLEVNGIYHQLVETYDSSDTEVDVEIMPSSSRMLRSLPSRYMKNHNDWKSEAQILFDAIWDCEDSIPFRAPVSLLKYPDYHNQIKNPMDLSTVKEKLTNNRYDNPNDFYNDMVLIFHNSRIFNTNQRSRIYVMTLRLAGIFEEHITTIIRNWKMAKRRVVSSSTQSQDVKREVPAATESPSTSGGDHASEVDVVENGSKKSSDPGEDSSENEDNEPLTNFQVVKEATPASDSDDAPLTTLKSNKSTKLDSEEEEEDSSDDSSASGKPSGIDEESDDSEDSYKPKPMATRNSRKRAKSSSSDEHDDDDDDDEDDSESSDDDGPSRRSKQVTRQNGRSSKRLRVCNNGRRSGRNKNKRKKRIVTNDDSSDDGDNSFVTSVSSRGRVRKLNPRFKALMKN